MSKILNVDEMLEALQALGHPEAAVWIGKVESLANELAAVVAKAIGCECGPADFEPGFGGTCAAFSPPWGSEMAWPEALEHVDPGGEFTPLNPT